MPSLCLTRIHRLQSTASYESVRGLPPVARLLTWRWPPEATFRPFDGCREEVELPPPLIDSNQASEIMKSLEDTRDSFVREIYKGSYVNIDKLLEVHCFWGTDDGLEIPGRYIGVAQRWAVRIHTENVISSLRTDIICNRCGKVKVINLGQERKEPNTF